MSMEFYTVLVLIFTIPIVLSVLGTIFWSYWRMKHDKKR